MTIREQLEVLGGEEIHVLGMNYSSIPCIETSDSNLLFKNPVVSVVMITYNHEPYIGRAIEGVMNQKTDFPIELIIGEDCSTDRTREICFEYQKRFPDRIRVLWWHENVTDHGRNSNNTRRCQARCRGEFIATCEGDDYWIDPFKLQKQVDVMRRHSNVGLCFCGSKIYYSKDDIWETWDESHTGFNPGLIASRKYMLYSMFGREPGHLGPEFFQMTATFMARKSVLMEAIRRYDLFDWQLRVGDGVFSIGIGSLSDVYYLPDVVSVYWQTTTGASFINAEKGFVETMMIRLYYLVKVFGLRLADAPDKMKARFLLDNTRYIFREKGDEGVEKYWRNLLRVAETHAFVNSWSLFWLRYVAMKRRRRYEIINSIWVRRFFPYRVTRSLREWYKRLNGNEL